MRQLWYVMAAAAGITVAIVVLLITAHSQDPPAASQSPPAAPPFVSSAAPQNPVPQPRPAIKEELTNEKPHDGSIPLTRDGVIARLGGKTVAEILENPKTVVAALLEPVEMQRMQPHLYALRTPEVTVNKIQADRISQAILDPQRNLQFNSVKGCIPRFGLRLSYLADGGRVDLYFCLECALLAVYLDGKPLRGSQIDEIRNFLREEAIKIFPDDQPLRTGVPFGMRVPSPPAPPDADRP
jgi:hypothetical protein